MRGDAFLNPGVHNPLSSISSQRNSLDFVTVNAIAAPTPRAPASISASTSAPSSSNDLFYDAEEPDYQTKRRSMYRSQGTASSPDLATLVRKAKQRANIKPGSNNKDKRHEVAPPLPTSPNPPPNSTPRHRQRSSTSSSGNTMPTTTPTTAQKGKLQKPSPSTGASSGAERVPPTSSGHDDGSVKANA